VNYPAAPALETRLPFRLASGQVERRRGLAFDAALLHRVPQISLGFDRKLGSLLSLDRIRMRTPQFPHNVAASRAR